MLHFSTKQLSKSNQPKSIETTKNEIQNLQQVKKREPKTNFSTKTPNEEIDDDSSKNLANFFNGEIIDLEE